MVIKLKSIVKSRATITLLMILNICLISLMVHDFTSLKRNLNYELMINTTDSFYDSKVFTSTLSENYYDLYRISKYSLPPSIAKKILNETFSIEDDYGLRNEFDRFKDKYDDNYEEKIKSGTAEKRLSDAMLKEEFSKQYADEIELVKNEKLQEMYRTYLNTKSDLNKNTDFMYCIEYGDFTDKSTPTITKEDILSLPYHYVITATNLEVGNPKDPKYHSFFNKIGNLTPPEGTVIYAGYTAEFLSSSESKWAQDLANSRPYVSNFYNYISILIVLMVLLLFAVSIRAFEQRYESNKEKDFYLFLDLHIILAVAAGTLMGVMLFTSNGTDKFPFYLQAIIYVLFTFTILTAFTQTLKYIILRQFLSHTLTFRILRFAFNLVKGFFKGIGRNLLKGLHSLIFNTPVRVKFLFSGHAVNDYKIVCKSVKEIKNGNLTQSIAVSEYSIYSDMVEDLNEIQSGFKKSVETAVKSEKLKSELITNVSHDIKTPLTSIINYIDLLKLGQCSKEEQDKYLSILEQKSQRLKILIEDLFEASKINSGNITVSLTNINAKALLQQVLGEADDRISKSSLDFKVTYDENPLQILADGRHMHRVFDNLLSNLFKYAMPNTRVYINFVNEEDFVVMTFKNISSYELNIDPNHLLERFTQGENARNIEGNGLGLSIAKSLVNAMNGKLDIIVDGDLFKIIIVMPKSNL